MPSEARATISQATVAFRLRESATQSSIKALPKLMRAKSTAHWILWLITLMFGVSVGLYLLAELWISYFKYEVTLSTSVEDGGRPPFPDVTVCNLNPLWNNAPGWGLLADIDGFSDLLTYDQYIFMLLNTSYKIDSNDTIFDGTNAELYSVNGYLKHTEYTSKALEILGKAFVWKCIWQTESQSHDCIVIPIITPTNGLCYTIRPPPGEGIQVKTRQEGLSVILFLNNTDLRFVADYRINPFQTYTEGAKIVVHSRGTVPEMAEGFIVSPGTNAFIVAKYFKRTMLPSPYSNCQDDLRLDMFDHIEAKDLWNYTQYACRSLCYQSHVIKECHCLDSTEIVFAELSETFRFCSTLRKGNLSQLMADLHCTSTVKAELDSDKTCHDKCRVPCRQEYYTAETNQVQWPNDIYILSLYNIHLKSDHLPAEFDEYYGTAFDLMTKGNTTEAMQIVSSTNLIQKNFLQLSITMNDAITSEEDKEAVTISSVFGSLGGILNLWIGFTFLTIMEIIDFFLTIAMDKLCQNKLRKAKENKECVNSTQTVSIKL